MLSCSKLCVLLATSSVRPQLVPITLKSFLNLTLSPLRYYSVSIFCKVGAPGYIASVVFGIVVTVATACVIPTIDKVM